MNKNPCLDLPQVPLHPTQDEIIEEIRRIPNWHTLSSKAIVGELMRHYRGNCSPVALKEVVGKIYIYGIK